MTFIDQVKRSNFTSKITQNKEPGVFSRVYTITSRAFNFFYSAYDFVYSKNPLTKQREF